MLKLLLLFTWLLEVLKRIHGLCFLGNISDSCNFMLLHKSIHLQAGMHASAQQILRIEDAVVFRYIGIQSIAKNSCPSHEVAHQAGILTTSQTLQNL